MSEALIESAEHSATPCPSVVPMKDSRPKIPAPGRKAQLRAEINLLIKERSQLRTDVATLRADCQHLRSMQELEKTNRRLQTENDALLERLAFFEQEEQTLWQRYVDQCAQVRKIAPDFDDCCRAIGTVPDIWRREIVRLPNAAQFILFLGRGREFLQYLHELKPEAAVSRIRQAAYDLQQQTSKGTANGGKT